MEPSLFSLFNLGVIAFLTVCVLLPGFCRIAVRNGFVDRPGGRKEHERKVPPIGGLVIFPVFIILAFVAGMDIREYWPLITALALLLITGAMDDKMDVKASVKFFIQFVAAFLIVVPGGTVIGTLGCFLWPQPLYTGFMGIPFTIFCVMLLINAINMMDGLDGLAGGKSFIILLWLAVAAGMSGNAGNQLLYIVLLMGTLGGFLYYNMRSPITKKAKVFLGDSGSMALGLVLAWFAIRLAQSPYHAVTPISVAWILALPVIDAFGLFVIRIASGRHPFSADRLHFHHHFINAGIPAGQSTLLILAIGYVFGLIGYGGFYIGVPEFYLTYAWIALLATHTFLTVRSKDFIAFLEKAFRKTGRAT
jgi:UDP-GlcNAc:undecaprenyl-phosphate GlcNAc-1-phosphate transferase